MLALHFHYVFDLYTMQADFYLLSSHDKNAHHLFLCRLVEKIYRQNHTLYIHCKDRQEMEYLDELLWTFSDTSFIPHCLIAEAPSLPPPILLGFDSTPMKRDILINLSTTIPIFYHAFQRILEIVPQNDELQSAARERYQFYKTKNLALHTHKINQ